MAGSANPGLRRAWIRWALAALCCLPASGQPSLSLVDLEARRPPQFAPAHEGERAKIRGVVADSPFHFPGYTLLAIQDAQAGGALHVSKGDTRLDGFRPGDELEAVGVVAAVGGMPVLDLERINLLGHKEAPAPVTVEMRDLQRFPHNLRYLGRLVRVDARVLDWADTTSGASLLVGSNNEPYKFFIPSAGPVADLTAYHRGDRVLAEGVALQFCPRPNYDHYFELLVLSPDRITRLERPWGFPPLTLALGLFIILFTGYVLWSRERRLRKQRERLRRTYQLGEEILGSASATAILKRISEALPGILGVTRVHLYLHDRAARTLEAPGAEESGEAPISLASPPGGAQAGAVACFHYRTLLVIPDIGRSPFPVAGDGSRVAPKSLLFVPMLAQGEVTGVLELDQDDRLRDFTADEQALAQHLGNQIGVALRLMDQRSVQEQLFRTEKLAAVGRLISGIVNELQAPLSSITELAGKAREKARGGPGAQEVDAIGAEARKAAGMVARLVTFGSTDLVEARPVCITTLLRSLLEFRESDFKASGIKIEDLASGEPLFVMGAQGQLEQVFLTLLVHAEQALAESARKVISIRTSVLAKRLVVEIAFTASPDSRQTEEPASVLGVARSVIAGHGGDVRLVQNGSEPPRFEVELPVASKDHAGALAAALPSRDSSRGITALVIEPDEPAQRQLLALLAARGCRVVPVANADTALELAQRMRFDAAFCSVHAPGLNWVELSERMQLRVGGFILLSDRYDVELSADFEGEGRFVLPKPVQERELDRILRKIDVQAPGAPR
jgi:signal transduction histidine kinase/CheY-like chemotaxis protein